MSSLSFDPTLFEGELSIYVHIPFCTSKCDYCDFYSIPSTSGKKIERYVQNVCQELQFVLSHMDRRPHSLYLGGGNPGLLTDLQLEQILVSVGGSEGIAEVSMESNPAQITSERLTLLSSLGIDRLSVGIQTLREKNLLFIGRNGSVEESRRALALLGNEWHGRLSVDLITSIPGSDSLDTLKDLIETRSLCEYDHVSIYDLTIEDDTPLAGRIDSSMLRNDHGFDLEQEEVEAYLYSIGFSKYEVSNYSKGGMRSVHNLQYFRYRPYIGIGPGAGSTLFASDRVFRVQALPQLDRYLFETRPFCDTIYESQQLEDKEILKELLMMGLRCNEGVDLRRLDCFFGPKVRSEIEQYCSLWVERFLADLDQERLSLTRMGSLVANSLTSELFDLVDRIGTVRYRLCT